MIAVFGFSCATVTGVAGRLGLGDGRGFGGGVRTTVLTAMSAFIPLPALVALRVVIGFGRTGGQAAFAFYVPVPLVLGAMLLGFNGNEMRMWSK